MALAGTIVSLVALLAGASVGLAQAATPAPFDPSRFDVKLALVADGFERPVDVADPGDGSGRLFVVEQRGRVRILQDGRILEAPFLDIVDRVGSEGNEQGLLSIAFHPDYRRNGRFYVDYTDTNGNTVVARYDVAKDDPNRADPGSAQTLLTVEQPYPNHNGGLLLFGPERYLYIGLGDGGSQGDPHRNGQNKASLLGKLLRIDVDRQAGGKPYAIPPDNPFVNDRSARPEIWAYGLRNPWRFSFDRATGDLYIADVGQNQYEEVDFQPAKDKGGENYGWNIREGKHCYPEDATCDTGGLVDPVAEYTHDDGCSITGGYVYRGQRVPALAGVYLFADYCSGLLWGLGRDASGAWVTSDPIKTGLNPSSFGEDAAGELYLTDLNGAVYRVGAAES